MHTPPPPPSPSFGRTKTVNLSTPKTINSSYDQAFGTFSGSFTSPFEAKSEKKLSSVSMNVTLTSPVVVTQQILISGTLTCHQH